MKNRILFFLFLGLLPWKNSNAQAYIYHPFPDSGAIWLNGWVDQGIPCIFNPSIYDIYELGKDTIVDGFKYREVLFGGDTVCSAYSYVAPVWRGDLIRDDTLNKEIFILDIGNNVEQLLYDFNLNVGDTIPNGYGSVKSAGIIVTRIDSILLENGTYRKRFKLNCTLNDEYYDTLALIEGIGYTGGLFKGISFGDGFEGGVHLACNSYNDTLFYNFAPFGLQNCDIPTGIKLVKKTQITISPNPVFSGGSIIIKGISENYSLSISDVLGQIIFFTQMNNSQSINLPDSIKSGVYICRILTEDNLLMIKKIVVL